MDDLMWTNFSTHKLDDEQDFNIGQNIAIFSFKSNLNETEIDNMNNNLKIFEDMNLNVLRILKYNKDNIYRLNEILLSTDIKCIIIVGDYDKDYNYINQVIKDKKDIPKKIIISNNTLLLYKLKSKSEIIPFYMNDIVSFTIDNNTKQRFKCLILERKKSYRNEKNVNIYVGCVRTFTHLIISKEIKFIYPYMLYIISNNLSYDCNNILLTMLKESKLFNKATSIYYDKYTNDLIIDKNKKHLKHTIYPLTCIYKH